jgi:hypothetical protein
LPQLIWNKVFIARIAKATIAGMRILFLLGWRSVLGGFEPTDLAGRDHEVLILSSRR